MNESTELYDEDTTLKVSWDGDVQEGEVTISVHETVSQTPYSVSFPLDSTTLCYLADRLGEWAEMARSFVCLYCGDPITPGDPVHFIGDNHPPVCAHPACLKLEKTTVNIWTEENRADPDTWNQVMTAYKALKAAPPLTDPIVLGEPLTRESLLDVIEEACRRTASPEDMEEGTEFLKDHYSFMNPAAELWREMGKEAGRRLDRDPYGLENLPSFTHTLDLGKGDRIRVKCYGDHCEEPLSVDDRYEVLKALRRLEATERKDETLSRERVKDILLYIENNPYDNEDELEEMFKEWCRQHDRILELERQVIAKTSPVDGEAEGDPNDPYDPYDLFEKYKNQQRPPFVSWDDYQGMLDKMRTWDDRVSRIESAVFTTVGEILGCKIYIENAGDAKAEAARRILDRALRDLAVFGKDVE